MRRVVSTTAGKPLMRILNLSCTSHTSSAVSEGDSLPSLAAPLAAAVDMPAFDMGGAVRRGLWGSGVGIWSGCAPAADRAV